MPAELEVNVQLERVKALRAFAAETGRLPILVQEDPDPDAMAVAMGVRVLLHRLEDDSPIVSLGEVTRAENRRMAELLGIRVTRVTPAEVSGFEKVMAVDMQPRGIEHPPPRFGIIDHHPRRDDDLAADFVDIRPEYGAASTMITEYLRADGESQIHQKLATALLYGIRTDTDTLLRSASSADVAAYAFLQDRADLALLRRIARPSFPVASMRALGRALAEVRVADEIAVAYLGKLAPGDAHILPLLSDFCLSLEGVSWAAGAAVIGDELSLAIRWSGTGADGPGAGHVARALALTPEKGGGHATMARVSLPVGSVTSVSPEAGSEVPADAVLELLRETIDRVRSENGS